MVTFILVLVAVVFGTMMIGSFMSEESNGVDRQTDLFLTTVVSVLFLACVIGILVQNHILYIELDLSHAEAQSR